MSNRIIIETISTGHPDFLFREFVTLVNQSAGNVDLTGWRVVWTEIPTGRELHQITFTWSKKTPFRSGRKIFLISGSGQSGFLSSGQSQVCNQPHWQIFTNSRKHICSVPHVKVTLYDHTGLEIDNRYSIQGRDEPKKQPAIVIGHGHNPAWRDLRDHLHDLHRFEVEAFETDPRAGHTIPDVIAGLGQKSNMAILVMTGEDETASGLHPRLNVVQELGKFQERFGTSKTIILAETGVTVPTNNSGIIYISFAPGHIRSTFGDVVAAIRREFSLL